MTRARDIADLAGAADAGTVAGANLIINGDMAVWQRSTSSSSSGYQTADRFYQFGSNGLTYAQSTDVPTGEGFTYSLSTSGTPSGEWNVGQSIELPADGDAGVFFNGQKITISYWAKSSVAGDKIWNALLFRDSHQSSSNQSIVDFDNTDNNELTTSWARYTKKYTINVNPNGTNKALTLQIRSRNNAETSSTPSGNISITGVKLEVGSTATPFVHESYGDNLAKCQRFFYSTDDSGSLTNYITGGVESSTTAAMGGFVFPTQMRSVPSVAFLGTNVTKFFSSATGTDNSVSVSTNRSSKDVGSFVVTGFTGATAGQVASLYDGGSGSGITFDAEL